MTEEKEDIQAQVEGLATLIVLDDEVRRLTNLREFAFFSTNETHRLIPYHTAFLWQNKDFLGPLLIMQSGTAELDAHAPINHWVNMLIELILKSEKNNQIHEVTNQQKELENVEESWPDTLPFHVLWCPFTDNNKQINGGLLFFREESFQESEIKMIAWLISSYQYAWIALNKPSYISTLQKLKEKPYLIGLACVLIIILFFPVHLTVLGNATVIPADPILINSPMQGIIKKIYVSPGDKITRDQVLFSMEKADLEANENVNEKNLLLTKTKLRAVVNESFNTPHSSAEEPILKAQLAIDEANLNYVTTLLEKADVKSPINGIVIFDSKDEWLGQPVRTGERILVVADPKDVALKITIPIAENIKLEKNDNGDFYMYGTLNPIPIKITTLGYNAVMLPNKILAYQLRAQFTSTSEMPLIGSQGTVKLYGKHVPFIYYLLRKPIQAMRISLDI